MRPIAKQSKRSLDEGEGRSLYATNDRVAWYVTLSVTRLRCAKTAERIEVRFGVETFRGPRNILLDGGPDPSGEGEEEWGKILPIVKCRKITRDTVLCTCTHTRVVLEYKFSVLVLGPQVLVLVLVLTISVLETSLKITHISCGLCLITLAFVLVQSLNLSLTVTFALMSSVLVNNI